MLTPEQVQEIQQRFYPMTRDFRITKDFEIGYEYTNWDGHHNVTIEVHEMPYPVADLIRSWGYTLPTF